MTNIGRFIIPEKELDIYRSAAEVSGATIYGIVTTDDYIGPGEYRHPGRELSLGQVSLKICTTKPNFEEFWHTLGEMLRAEDAKEAEEAEHLG